MSADVDLLAGPRMTIYMVSKVVDEFPRRLILFCTADDLQKDVAH